MSLSLLVAAFFALALIGLHAAAAHWHWQLASCLIRWLERLTVAVAISLLAIMFYLSLCGSADACLSVSDWFRNLEQTLRDWFHSLPLG